MKRKILVILPTLPYPLSAGGNQAMYNGISAIKDNYDVTVVYLEYYNKSATQNRLALQKKWGNVQIIPFVYNHRNGLYKLYNWFVDKIAKIAKVDRSPDFKADQMKAHFRPAYNEYEIFVNNLIKEQDFDLVQLEMIPCLPFVLSLPKEIKKVFVHHELRFVVNELQLDEMGKSLYQKANLEYAKILEIGMLNKCDAIITLSKVDKEKLIEEGVSSPVYTSFACIDSIASESVIKNLPKYRKTLSFVGPFHHRPNYMGLLWFLENCWEKLLRENGEYQLNVVGRWPDSVIHRLTSKYCNLYFLGFVDKLENALNGSTMIVPITVGSGIRMKILEAASLGVPFVSTRVGCEGLPFENGRDCFIADSPDDFVDDIKKLSDSDVRQSFAKNAYELVKEAYSVSALEKNRMDVYSHVLQESL